MTGDSACTHVTVQVTEIRKWIRNWWSWSGSLVQLCYCADVVYVVVLCNVSECPRREIYFIALIDVLTNYGVKKRTAQAAKTMKHGAGAEISTVKPDQYARRFMEFVEKIIE